MPRHAVVIPIGAAMFAPVIKEADIVVAILDRLDLAFDEFIKFGEIVGDMLGDFKQGHTSLSMLFRRKVDRP
jgi:hypothetical protein